MILFHITHPEHVETIRAEGIKPNDDSEIFAVHNLIVANSVAVNQIFAQNGYAVFAIHPRYVETATVVVDAVAEFTASYHAVIVTDDPIPPESILYLGTYETKDYDEWSILVEWITGGGKMTIEELREQRAKLWADSEKAEPTPKVSP